VELALDFLDEWSKIQGDRTGTPHAIICHLHRVKIDANRNRANATDAGPEMHGDVAWQTYHNGIASAIQKAIQSFGFAMVVDLHGQSHRPATELGYLLTTEDLQATDEVLDQFGPELYTKCSIGSLAHPKGHTAGPMTRKSCMTLSQVVRGQQSLGGLMETAGFKCIPSPNLLRPLQDETYFWGAFTCARYSRGLHWKAEKSEPEDLEVGASFDAGSRRVVAVQVEVETAVRSDPVQRTKFAAALAFAEFLTLHFGLETLAQRGGVTS